MTPSTANFSARLVLLVVVCLCLASSLFADELLKRADLSAQSPEVVGTKPDLSFDLPEGLSGIEDVLWFETGPEAEKPATPAGVGEGPALRSLGEGGGAAILKFSASASPAGTGPELRLRREGDRPELRIDLRQSARWLDTGAHLALAGKWRLRARFTLLDGDLKLFLKDLDKGLEFSLGSFRCDRRLEGSRFSRVVEAGPNAGFNLSVSRWDLWKLDNSSLKPCSDSALPEGVNCFRPECVPSVSGAALLGRLPSGEVLLTLRSPEGLHEDMQLLDSSAFEPPGRAIRMTGPALNGKYFLRLDDGPSAVEHPLRVPAGDLEIAVVFRVPASLPRDRQLHLIHFKDSVTGVDPVGPAVYLDYGVASDHSNLVLQVSAGKYLTYPLDVKPDTWYRLLLKVNRASAEYVASFGLASEAPKPLNSDAPAGFYAGAALPESVRWQFFSQRTWRASADTPQPGSDKPALAADFAVTSVRLWRTLAADPSSPEPLVIRGLKPSTEGLPDFGRAQLDLDEARLEVLVKNSPSVGITPEVLLNLGAHKLLTLDGTIHFPNPLQYVLQVKADGPVFIYLNDRRHAALSAPKPGEAPSWGDVPTPSWGSKDFRRFRLVYLPPEGATVPHCELRWKLPDRDPEPIPVQAFTGAAYDFPWYGQFTEMRDLTAHDGNLYGLSQWTGLYRFRIEPDRLVFDKGWGQEGEDERGRPQNWSIVRFGLWNITGIAWDESSNGFWLAAPGSGGILLLAKPDFKSAYDRSGNWTWRIGCKSLAATPRKLYVVTPEGVLLGLLKYSVVTTTVPIDAMIGRGNKLVAVAANGSDILVATSPDSARPNHVFCIDPDSGTVHYAVDLHDKLSTIWSMAVDGDFLFINSESQTHFIRVKLPRVSVAPQAGPFLELDALLLQPATPAGDQPRELEGSLTSPVIPVPEDVASLDWVNWRETSFDPAHGKLEVSFRSAPEPYDIDRLPWQPLANQQRLALPLDRFLQYRVVIRTGDPWHSPGLHDLIFGLSSAPSRVGFSLYLKISAAVVGLIVLAWIIWLLLGKPPLWPRKDQPSS